MSLDSLVQTPDLKFIFVGGKGGVGKTTSSSAIASLLATNRRVLLVSTDPAHSLGDAWRTKFGNVPKRVIDETSNGGSILDIMEVDPQESLQSELKHWTEVSKELFASVGDGDGDMSAKVGQFQEWLSGIPGIDEATALSTAIKHIESGNYDTIVFDTAPTGHTLKLLALPEILEQGIDKLQSWQSTLWGYWQAFKTAGSSGSLSKAQKRANLQQQVTDRLQNYKQGIQKVALMLQDQQRTRFVVVCIAEFLSVSETQRLLQELAKNKVVASHIVVNQLVQDALNTQDLAELESLAEIGNVQLPSELLKKTVHACRLTSARQSIQQKYLQDLKNFPETQSMLDGICEVPLLAEEVTGIDAIRRFAKLLAKNAASSVAADSSGGNLYDDLIAAKNRTFRTGDRVQITGLAKSPQYNDLEGKVTTPLQDTGRYGVKVVLQSEGSPKKTKTLSLLPQNIVLIEHSEKKMQTATEDAADTPMSINPIMDKAKKVLEDPEIKELVAQNPRFKAAVEECLASPMNVMKYLSDPEMSPLISKAMSKM